MGKIAESLIRQPRIIRHLTGAQVVQKKHKKQAKFLKSRSPNVKQKKKYVIVPYSLKAYEFYWDNPQGKFVYIWPEANPPTKIPSNDWLMGDGLWYNVIKKFFVGFFRGWNRDISLLWWHISRSYPVFADNFPDFRFEINTTLDLSVEECIERAILNKKIDREQVEEFIKWTDRERKAGRTIYYIVFPEF